MPFKSQAQRRLFYAKMNRGEISKETVDEWERATPKSKKLPEHIKKAIYKVANGMEAGDEKEEESIPITEGKKVPSEALTTFFQANPSPVDAQIHELASAYGTDPHTMESQIYSLLGDKMKTGQDLVPGGKADDKPKSDFDPQQRAMGKKVEMEHTDNPALAKEIASDHLEEFDKYYTALKNMETKLKEGKTAAYRVGLRHATLTLIRGGR